MIFLSELPAEDITKIKEEFRTKLLVEIDKEINIAGLYKFRASDSDKYCLIYINWEVAVNEDGQLFDFNSFITTSIPELINKVMIIVVGNAPKKLDIDFKDVILMEREKKIFGKNPLQLVPRFIDRYYHMIRKRRESLELEEGGKLPVLVYCDVQINFFLNKLKSTLPKYGLQFVNQNQKFGLEDHHDRKNTFKVYIFNLMDSSLEEDKKILRRNMKSLENQGYGVMVLDVGLASLEMGNSRFCRYEKVYEEDRLMKYTVNKTDFDEIISDLRVNVRKSLAKRG